jgi:hypothetical protein
VEFGIDLVGLTPQNQRMRWQSLIWFERLTHSGRDSRASRAATQGADDGSFYIFV